MTALSRSLKSFATRAPFVFALLCFVIAVGILIVAHFFTPASPVNVIYVIVSLLELFFAIGVLALLGWLRAAGFNGPAQWRDLRVLWLPILVTLLTLSPLPFAIIKASNAGLVWYAILIAVLAGLNEEAVFRGLILQSLRPYGPITAATISALFFGLIHLNNLFAFGLSLLVISQVIWAFLLGFAYAAFRLRTGTIWPLMLLHACSDVAINVNLFADTQVSVARNSTFPLLVLELILIGIMLILAIYGFFLLRSSASKKPEPMRAAHEL